VVPNQEPYSSFEEDQEMAETESIIIEKLIENYEVLLLDAYGVLVQTSGLLPGAVQLITELNRIQKPYYILTNDASKLPDTTAKLFQSFGLKIEPDKIITSGALLKDYFRQKKLKGKRCVVLGPDDSVRYAEFAGGQVVPAHCAFDVLVIGDESGYPFLETVDTVLTGLFDKLDHGDWVHMVLPNPDLIYPKSDHGFGIASGSIALIFEAALQRRYPSRQNLYFDRLGKPHAAIYQEALRRSSTRDMVMIGDQLETDIRGAIDFGIDSVLVATGVTQVELSEIADHLRPNYCMQSIALGRKVGGI
jgi:HAD superfamily hydrolase (TIGR01450 family)